MRKCIILILITGIVWAQTGFDKLITKAGTKYWGEYSKVEDKIVYFKPNNALEFQAVPLELIETLKLIDGAVLIQSGRINENTLSFRKFSKEYEKLTIEEKAIYDKKEKINKFFTMLIICSVIMVSIVHSSFDDFMTDWDGPIFTPPDA